MKRIISFSISFLLIGITIVLAQEEWSAIQNVNIIPMTSVDLVKRNQTILIRNGAIEAIGDMDEIKVPSGAVIINGDNGYLIPGLTEMHAHIPPKRQGDDLIEETLFLYLSNGITTIRGMLGESYHLELRTKVSEGRILGPRIYTSGPSLNGNSVKTVEAARTMVTGQQKAGYDFLKLHPGLQLEVFDEIVKTAKEVGIQYSGHVSIDVGVRHAIESEYASIDHVDGYVEGLVSRDSGVEPNQNGFFGINFTDIADRSFIPELSELTKARNVWVVPTQSLMERWVGPSDAETLAMDDEMKYMSSETVNRWVTTKKSYTSSDSYSKEMAARFVKLRQDIIKSLHDSGVGIVLGSDAPQVFNVPGFSIQNELESMIRCGLTPYEALVTGTANPARFFNQEGKYGTIVEGAFADLILLTDNPLENISNTRGQNGVMVRGLWLSPQEIQNRLKDISRKYQFGK